MPIAKEVVPRELASFGKLIGRLPYVALHLLLMLFQMPTLPPTEHILLWTPEQGGLKNQVPFPGSPGQEKAELLLNGLGSHAAAHMHAKDSVELTN